MLDLEGVQEPFVSHFLMTVIFLCGIKRDEASSMDMNTSHTHTHTLQTYNLMSECWFTHASPTLFHSGTCRPQLSSCFLLCMKDDSIEVCNLLPGFHLVAGGGGGGGELPLSTLSH